MQWSWLIFADLLTIGVIVIKFEHFVMKYEGSPQIEIILYGGEKRLPLGRFVHGRTKVGVSIWIGSIFNTLYYLF